MILAAMAMELQQGIGQRLTAYGVGIRSPKAVGRLARGEELDVWTAAGTDVRLRHLHELYTTLREQEADDTIRAWLVGSNPHLNDQAPLEVFREGKWESALRAAQEFVR